MYSHELFPTMYVVEDDTMHISFGLVSLIGHFSQVQRIGSDFGSHTNNPTLISRCSKGHTPLADMPIHCMPF